MIKTRNKKLLMIIAILLLMTTIIGVYTVSLGNVTVNYFDDYTSRQKNDDTTFSTDPGCIPDKLSTKPFTIVITEPFASLNSVYETKIIKKITANNGNKKFYLRPGKYGLYIELEDGNRILYEPLILSSPKKDVRRDLQGPWYVSVNPFMSEFNFYGGAACAL